MCLQGLWPRLGSVLLDSGQDLHPLLGLLAIILLYLSSCRLLLLAVRGAQASNLTAGLPGEHANMTVPPIAWLSGVAGNELYVL